MQTTTPIRNILRDTAHSQTVALHINKHQLFQKTNFDTTIKP